MNVNAGRPERTAAAAQGAPPFGMADLMLIGVALIWGLNVPLIKLSLTEFNPLAFNAVRFTLATAVSWGMLLAARAPARVERRDLLPLTLLGMLGHGLYQVLFIEGAARTSGANVTVLLGTIPVNVALISAVLRVEVVGPRVWAGILLAFAGIAGIIGGSPRLEGATLTGDLMIFTGTLMVAVYTALSTRYLRRYHPLAYSAWTMTLGTPLLAIFSVPALIRQPWREVTAVGWGGLIYSAVFAIGVAYYIYNDGLKRIGSVRTVLYGNLAPFVGVAASALILGDQVSAVHVAGAALVVGGVLVARLPVRTHGGGAAAPAGLAEATGSTAPKG